MWFILDIIARLVLLVPVVCGGYKLVNEVLEMED